MTALIRHTQQQRAPVGMMLREIAELGLVIGATPGTDDDSGFHAGTSTKRNAASTMSSADGRVAA